VGSGRRQNQPESGKEGAIYCAPTRDKEGLDVEGGLDVGGAVAIEAGGGDGLGEDDADGDEDGAGAGSEGDGDFDASAFGILIAAAEAEAAFGEIFADGDFFVKAAVADAGEDAGFDARAVAAGNDALFDGGGGRAGFRIANLGLRFDPDGRRLAKAADACDAFADLEGFQLDLVEIDDFAALAKAAFHEKTREGFFALVRGGEIDVPEVGARVKDVDGVEEVIGRVLVDFCDNAGAGAFRVVAVESAAKVKLLARGKFFREAKDAAIAADEQSFGVLLDSVTSGRDPGGLDGHAESHAVTLPESVRFCGHGAINKSPEIRLARQDKAGRLEKRGFVVPSNNTLEKNWVPTRGAGCCLFGVLARSKNYWSRAFEANYGSAGRAPGN